MLTETTVSTILTASITGAGLVLAVYALIIPLSRRYFSYRAERIYDEVQELKDRVRETNTRISQEEISELTNLIEGIQERQAVPTYLSWGAGFTFLGYVATTYLSFCWIVDFYRQSADTLIHITFPSSTIIFLLVGLLSIKDIYQTMKKEYEDLKKKVEETKSKTDISVEM